MRYLFILLFAASVQAQCDTTWKCDDGWTPSQDIATNHLCWKYGENQTVYARTATITRIDCHKDSTEWVGEPYIWPIRKVEQLYGTIDSLSAALDALAARVRRLEAVVDSLRRVSTLPRRDTLLRRSNPDPCGGCPPGYHCAVIAVIATLPPQDEYGCVPDGPSFYYDPNPFITPDTTGAKR